MCKLITNPTMKGERAALGLVTINAHSLKTPLHSRKTELIKKAYFRLKLLNHAIIKLFNFEVI